MSDTENNPYSEKQCYEDSHNWFIVNGVDTTRVDSVSLGKVIQLQVFEKLFESSQINSDQINIRSVLKSFNLEWMARAFASYFDGITDDEQAEVLLIFDVNNDPMIQALNTLGVTLRADGCSVLAVVVDKAIAKKCNIERKISWFQCLLLSDLVKVVTQLFRLHRSRFGSSKRCIKSLAQIYGADKSRKIASYFRWQSPQLLLEIRVLKSLLIKKKPSVVVLASDAHRVSRMFVFLCGLMQIKTVVYQHGATIWEYGYVPVYADRMLVWGESSKQWFVERGVTEDKLTKVGNLRSDDSGYEVISINDFTHKKKVYFFPNPIDRAVTDDVLSMFVDICDHYKLEGVVKLHPSEKNIQFFEERTTQTKSPISISVAPIHQAGVNPGDIAIVVNSTAGVDFCLEGGYVLNVEVDTMPNPIDYEGYGVGVKVSSSSYIEGFDRLLTLSAENYLVNRDVFIRSYLGVLDGRVKNRACEVIKEMAGL